MRTTLTPKLVAIVVVAVLVAAACGSDDSGGIAVTGAEYRTTPNDLGAAYLTIENDGDEPVTLTGASAPGVARIELHESTMTDGVMRMTPRPEGFTVEPGGSVVLEPGGKHLMLFEPSTGGDELDITLVFGDEEMVVSAVFDELGSATSDDMDHGDMEGMDMDEGDDMEGMDMEEPEG